jgi:hypothetical protein
MAKTKTMTATITSKMVKAVVFIRLSVREQLDAAGLRVEYAIGKKDNPPSLLQHHQKY